PADPPLPARAEPLARYVVPPAELSRRLAQIGIVERADWQRLARELKPGQRLVSREGDLWRWDGFAAAANAQTAAARRLAQRNRLGDLERELAGARAEISAKRNAVERAEVELAAAIGAHAEARARSRTETRGARRGPRRSPGARPRGGAAGAPPRRDRGRTDRVARTREFRQCSGRDARPAQRGGGDRATIARCGAGDLCREAPGAD